VKKYCNLNLGIPDATPSKEYMAKTLVMIVKEQLFPCGVDIVRSRDLVQLAKNLRNVGTMVLEKYPRFGSLEEAIAKSLYIWFGCIQIDKACRNKNARGQPFDLQESRDKHDNLVTISSDILG
jgi:hypothetical protein